MSAIGSNVNVPSSNEHDNQPAGFVMQLVGGVYKSTPDAATDGQSQGLHVDSIGTLHIKNLLSDALYVNGGAADQDPVSTTPMQVGGTYAAVLPTYNNGDAAVAHVDVNGRLITSDYQVAQLSRSNGVTDAGTLRTKMAEEDAVQMHADLENIYDNIGDVIANTAGLNLLAKNTGAVDATTLRTKLADEDNSILVNIQSSGDTTATRTTTIATNSATIVTNTGATKTSVDTVNTSVGTMSAKLPATLGQKTMAASLAVTLASDQPALPVSFGTSAALPVKQAAIAVGTTAVRLTTDGAAPSSTRKLLRIQPDPAATGDFFYGSSTVTATGTTRGCQIFPAQTEIFESDNSDYYIISTVAAQTVYIVEVE